MSDKTRKTPQTSSSSSKRAQIHAAPGTSSKRTDSAAPASALNSVVSSLMRAAVGGVPTSIDDDELQRYIADKILEEAAASNKRYQEIGISAFTTPKSALPKPNKRFLASVIRDTDSHNDALLRKERLEAETRTRDQRRRRDEQSGRRRSRSRDRRRRDRSRSRSPRASGASERRRKRRRSSPSPSRTTERSPESDAPTSRTTILPVSHSSETLRETLESTDLRDPPLRVFPSTVKTPRPTLVKRGRGPIGSSRLDKFFADGYDPGLDMDNYDDDSLAQYIARLESLPVKGDDTEVRREKKRAKKEAKEKRKKKKERKKSKKSKRDEIDEESDTASDGDRLSVKVKGSRDTVSNEDARNAVRLAISNTPKPLPATCPW
ncbi:hypothetical protein HKX48_006087 [Thoreauomyces humboldtii]|nr:hypothetical protein HKX48_006087 [Thoreauomyces humboldtii]